MSVCTLLSKQKPREIPSGGGPGGPQVWFEGVVTKEMGGLSRHMVRRAMFCALVCLIVPCASNSQLLSVRGVTGKASLSGNTIVAAVRTNRTLLIESHLGYLSSQPRITCLAQGKHFPAS